MKKYFSIFLLFLLFSCTSNTIFKEPKNLIPRDTMSLLIQEMMIASSAKYIKNKSLERNINYMPFVFDKFKIDSTRFLESNTYYMSKIDLYEKILTDAKNNLENKKKQLTTQKNHLDSVRRDSIKKAKIPLKEIDTIDDFDAN